jgi:hypothetical protein
MQKVKTSEWPLMAASMRAPLITLMTLTALTALLLGAARTARAEETAPQAEAAGGMDPNATVGDMIRLAKQVGEREFAARLNPPKKNAGKDGSAAAEPAMEKNPVLLALYGTDRHYKAELDVNGQSRVVPVPGPLQKMGPWKYIALMEEGVLLSKQPQDANPPVPGKAGSTQRGAVVACQQKETCLFLSVPKSAGDTRPLVAPDAQARLLVNQLPASRAGALEFGGKPQPTGERANAGAAVSASR